VDLNTIIDVVHPHSSADVRHWHDGDAWLGGGTWLFSVPQPHLRRLVDLNGYDWPALAVTPEGDLQIAATCTVAALYAFQFPVDWLAASLIQPCCRAFLASSKIWTTATVGGNLCLSLPAGPMIALTAALDGACTIWKAQGGEACVPVVDFITGNQRNVLAPGDLLRQITIKNEALKRRTALRQISLTPVGRSAALLIGVLDDQSRFTLTVTAATVRPMRLSFSNIPSSAEVRDAIFAIGNDVYHDDIHGQPLWRRSMTLKLAEEIRVELESATS
jgi:CO/xanthine dehydrogenase FAD-binding subunit